ncbi:Nuclear receptor subfamily 2 group E member [Ooceraea biroi]|uniref:Nuclear receptor subfamily 2 group E member n=1 Tax=Ooceraea biroi TaxID=2015173 RepID=A0A026X0Z7_OOCBI|nr:Nuclear receptor subfamily 2 group E member [Ooceraea biroi]
MSLDLIPGRILYDIPCKVCQDHSSGKHYGIFACDGCAGFFKRSIRRNRQYVCKAKTEGACMVDKTHRNQCRSCRLAKCVEVGMNKDAVQHERGPRNSTIRRQMALYFKEPEALASMTVPSQSTILNLALPKISAETHVAGPSPHSSISHPNCCSLTMPKVSPTPAGLPALPRLPPLPFITPITPEATCEQAARLLFLNVHWTRDLAASTGLAMEDQLALLVSSWRDLFLLATAQMIPSLDPAVLLSSRGMSLAVEVNRFREIIASFHMMHLDQHEYACVRAMVLFNSGLEGESAATATVASPASKPGRLKELATVAQLRDSAQLALGQRLNGDALRFGKLLLLLPTLRTVSARAIEELFFKRTIGEIPIERIMCDMYKT